MTSRRHVILFLVLNSVAGVGRSECADTSPGAIIDAMNYSIYWSVHWLGVVPALEPYSAGGDYTVFVEIDGSQLRASFQRNDRVISIKIGCDSSGELRPIGYPIEFHHNQLRPDDSVGALPFVGHPRNQTLNSQDQRAGSVFLSKMIIVKYALPDIERAPAFHEPSEMSRQTLVSELRSQLGRYTSELCGEGLAAIVPKFDGRDPIVFVRLVGNKCGGVLEVYQDPQDGWVGRRNFESAGDWKTVGDRVMELEWFRETRSR